MTNAIPSIAIALLTTILFTGGISPYSFANEYEDEEDYECEIPAVFAVMYNGPSDSQVEIYKKPKHANNSEKLLHSYGTQTFSSGDYIILDAENDLGLDQIKKRTTYKIMQSDGSEVIIPINTSCKRPLAVGDVHEKDGVTLTVMYGHDKDGDEVIYDRYHYDDGDDVQTCMGGSVIDFGESLVHGSPHADVVDYLGFLGIDYSVDSTHDISSIYDSTTYGGADPDLESPRPVSDEIKNLLIVQEHTSGPPDDDANGGTHVMLFDTPIELDSFRIIDIEGSEDDSFVKGYDLDENGNVINTVQANFLITGNKNQKLITETKVPELADFVDIDKLEFRLAGSGAITNLCIKDSEPPIEDGTIIVEKIAVPSENAPNFMFDGDLAGSITHGETISMNVVPGTYTSQELPLEGWALTDITCVEDVTPNSSGDTTTMAATFIVEEGEEVTCTFTNTEVTPIAFITIFNATTTDNGVDAPPLSAYGLEIDGDTTVSLGVQKQVDANTSIEIHIEVPQDFTRVVVVGDGCPTASDFENGDSAFVELEENQHLKCTVYYDDNGDGASGGEGIIFHRKSLEVTFNGFGMALTGTGACGLQPCAELDGSVFRVNDDKLDKISALVVFNMFPVIEVGNESAFVEKCQIFQLSLGTQSDLQFEFVCETIEAGKYRINYAVIDTDV